MSLRHVLCSTAAVIGIVALGAGLPATAQPKKPQAIIPQATTVAIDDNDIGVCGDADVEFRATAGQRFGVRHSAP